MLKGLILPKLKFGLGSILATSIDYLAFFYLLNWGISAWLAQGSAHFLGMTTNFIFQRNFVFQKERTVMSSFIYSLSFSILAILLSSTLIHYLLQIPFFEAYPLAPKLMVTVLLFFFNYYTKQFSFEKKISW